MTMLESLFGEAEYVNGISIYQPMIVGAMVDEECIDENIEVVVSLGGTRFCVIPVERVSDELVWVHEIVEDVVRNVLGVMDMEFLFNHNNGYQSVPVSHIMSALTTSAGVNNIPRTPDEYWNIIKAGLPFTIPEGCYIKVK